jgi:hypothetical protein
MAEKYANWNTGNDTTGDGLIGNPWKSATKLIGELSAGDIGYLRGGTGGNSIVYSECTGYGGSQARADGTAVNPIILKAYPGEKAVIDGRSPVIEGSGTKIGLLIQGDYWQVGDYDGALVIRYHRNLGLLFRRHWSPRDGATYVIGCKAINVTTHHNAETGVMFWGGGRDCEHDDLKSYDNRDNISGTEADGIKSVSAKRGNYHRGIFTRNTDDGCDHRVSTDNTKIYNNFVWRSGYYLGNTTDPDRYVPPVVAEISSAISGTVTSINVNNASSISIGDEIVIYHTNEDDWCWFKVSNKSGNTLTVESGALHFEFPSGSKVYKVYETPGGGGNGFKLPWWHEEGRSIIHNNLAIGGKNTGYMFVNSTGTYPGNNIYNCVAADFPVWGFYSRNWADVEHAVYKNNIIKNSPLGLTGGTGSSGIYPVNEYNNWSNNDGSNVTNLDIVAVDAHFLNVKVPAHYRNHQDILNSNLYKLDPDYPGGNPFINAGVDVGLQYEDTAPDLGWKETEILTIPDPPSTNPVISSPTANQQGVSTLPTIEYSASTNATSYDIQIATDAGISTLVVDINKSGTSYQIQAEDLSGASELSNNQEYYVQVRGRNTHGVSGWSASVRFWVKTAGSAPIQETPDYTQEAALNGSTSTNPIGYGVQRRIFFAKGRTWIFYSDGTNAVWRTKEGYAATGSFGTASNVFVAAIGVVFDVDYKDGYFHFLRYDGSNVKYRRGEANDDGTITFGTEVTAYTDATWVVQTFEPIQISVDHDGNTWSHVFVRDGGGSGGNRKSLILSNVNKSGGWTSRANFPKDCIPSYGDAGNGRNNMLMVLDSTKVLFVANDSANTRWAARLWTRGTGDTDEGTLGSLEATGRTSISTSYRRGKLSRSGIGFVSYGNTACHRRNTNNTWTDVSASIVSAADWNSLSLYGTQLRWWDYASTVIRNSVSTDDGANWGAQTTVWSGLSNVLTVIACQALFDDGDAHRVMWYKNGASPYTVDIGIKGEATLAGTLEAPAKVTLSSPIDTQMDVSILPEFSWTATDDTNYYDLQIASDSGFSTIVQDLTHIVGTSYTLTTELDYNETYYWRVRAVNEVGAGAYSDTRSFTTGDPGEGEDAENVDYSFTLGTSDSGNPIGNPYGNHGVYAVHKRFWGAYSDGDNCVLATKQIAPGGTVSRYTIFEGVTVGYQFGMTFDGTYFHFYRINDAAQIVYKRVTPNANGTVTQGTEDTIWEASGWSPSSIYHAMTINTNGYLVMIARIRNDSTGVYKPIAILSSTKDGTWTTAGGYPYDLDVGSTDTQHARALNVFEVVPGKILYTWQDKRNGNRMSARVNITGVWGGLEDTGLAGHGWVAKLGAVDGRAILNSQNTMARRDTDGLWTDITPPDIPAVNFNTWSYKNSRIYSWYYEGGDIKYRASRNYGDSWGQPVTKYAEENSDLLVSTIPINSKSDTYGGREYHATIWRVGGEAPYEIMMGVKEVVVVIRPEILSPESGAGGQPLSLDIAWESAGDGRYYHLQIATDSEFSNLVVNEPKLKTTSYLATLSPSSQYYIRVLSGVFE